MLIALILGSGNTQFKRGAHSRPDSGKCLSILSVVKLLSPFWSPQPHPEVRLTLQSEPANWFASENWTIISIDFRTLKHSGYLFHRQESFISVAVRSVEIIFIFSIFLVRQAFSSLGDYCWKPGLVGRARCIEWAGEVDIWLKYG